MAELLASAGYDFVQVDGQHSAFNRESLTSLFQAIKLGGAKSFIRVDSSEDRPGIQQAFDCGADGILVPCIRTADDCRRVVSFAKLPGATGLEGTRSMYVNLRQTFHVGAGIPGTITTYNDINKHTIIAIQIETKEAVENLDEILAVPGIDIALIGPGDLNSSLGLLGAHGFGAFTHPEFFAAVQKVATLCPKYGVIPGFFNSDLKQCNSMGFKFIIHNSDAELLRHGLEVSLTSSLTALNEGVTDPIWTPRPYRPDPSDV
eukprot:CAMPEP_0196762658 /NCGR_PEP_ID=MMETSP1095-20130614/2481_1 /TAXON_ID=96789 ORGANISM="Chromulina nebulosa, Strain UTEXLB2642" /NCGR_SAMPLE_ID=MMETSP1095 /ASSEMBLY_ACC=CAM_ASM_000446 /LENGTH=260 /DNA_ID=CAMNT_0042114121 /DNA_START=28 /DNA_END=810 /DNA_ORIENTATION=+